MLRFLVKLFVAQLDDVSTQISSYSDTLEIMEYLCKTIHTLSFDYFSNRLTFRHSNSSIYRL